MGAGDSRRLVVSPSPGAVKGEVSEVKCSQFAGNIGNRIDFILLFLDLFVPCLNIETFQGESNH